jgi:hypothetical protein
VEERSLELTVASECSGLLAQGTVRVESLRIIRGEVSLGTTSSTRPNLDA